MNRPNGSRGCQTVGLILVVLLLAIWCLAAGLTIGGGLGFVTGGAAGYAMGRTQSSHHLHGEEGHPPEIPFPMPEDDDWDWTPPEIVPGAEERPYLGVYYQMTEDGAQIEAVVPDTPADHAGLREGDIILSVDGNPVGAGDPSLSARILEYDPGDEVELHIRRNDVELEIAVTLSMQFELDP